MIAASGTTVSPLNSALTPEAGAAVSPAPATETTAPPPKGAAPFKVGLTPDFYNAEVCVSDSSYDSRHPSALPGLGQRTVSRPFAHAAVD